MEKKNLIYGLLMIAAIIGVGLFIFRYDPAISQKGATVPPDITSGPQAVVITDKAEYVQGENIAGTLKYDGSMYQWDRYAWSIQKFENGSWAPILRRDDPSLFCGNIPNCKDINIAGIEECPSLVLCEREQWYKVEGTPALIWDQSFETEEKSFQCNVFHRNPKTNEIISEEKENRICMDFEKVQPGRYKIRFEYATAVDLNDSFDRKIDIKYAETEFIIK